MGGTRKYLRAKTTGAKLAGVEFLAADVTPAIDDEFSTTLKIGMAFSVTAPVLEISFDSGVTWFELEGGVAIPVGQFTTIEIEGADNTDLINFKTDTIGGTTIDHFRVVSLPF